MCNNEVAEADDICGELTEAGGPCQRHAGWGIVEESRGPCVDHRREYRNPNKLTEDRIDRLVDAAEKGAFKKHCAMEAGLTPRTLRRWLDWGEEDAEADIDSQLADLFVRWQRARANGAVNCLKDAKPEFVLERSYGYVKTEQIAYSGNLNGFKVVIGGTESDSES